MTLRPVELVRVGVPPQDQIYEGLPALCQHPGCRFPGTETHHVVRRTDTAGPKNFVTVDGLVVLNVVRLCHEHHRQVTEHFAWVIYNGRGWWAWMKLWPEIPKSGHYVTNTKSGRVFAYAGCLKLAVYNPATREVEAQPYGENPRFER